MDREVSCDFHKNPFACGCRRAFPGGFVKSGPSERSEDGATIPSMKPACGTRAAASRQSDAWASGKERNEEIAKGFHAFLSRASPGVF